MEMILSPTFTRIVRSRSGGRVALAFAALVLAPGLAWAQEPAAPSEPPSPAEEIGSHLPEIRDAAPGAPEVAPAEPADLVFWNRKIVTFRAAAGQTSPERRVEAALERLAALSERELAETVTAQAGEIGGVHLSIVMVGGRAVFSVLPEDVDPLSDRGLDALAGAAAANLELALAARAQQRDLPNLLRGIGISLLATVLLVVFFRLWGRLRSWILKRMEKRSARLADTRLFEVDLGEQALATLHWVMAIAGWALRLAVVSFWLTFVLGRFPFTEPWADGLGAWFVETLGGFGWAVVGSLPGLGTVVLILLAARGLARLISRVLAGVEEGTVTVSWIPSEVARGTRRIAVLGVWIFAVAIAYPYVPGSSTGAFRSISVLVGLMFSIGSAGILNHVLAGWVILFSRGLKIGDFVRIGDVEGTVTQLGALSTKVLTRHREELTLPNAVVTSTITTNYSRQAAGDGCLASITLTIGYDAPWRQVHAMLELAARRTAGLSQEPPPRVLQRSLSDFYVEYELTVVIEHSRERARVLSELHGRIQDAFNESGVQIMSPHFVGQPADAVVVPRDRWFLAPAEPAEKE